MCLAITLQIIRKRGVGHTCLKIKQLLYIRSKDVKYWHVQSCQSPKDEIALHMFTMTDTPLMRSMTKVGN